MVGKSNRNFCTTRVRGDREGGFACVFQALAASVKSRYELVFIVDIARFQLAQKSINLVMFWLSKYAVNVY